MSRKHFSWLLAATVVLGVLVFLLPGGTSKFSEKESQILLPGLADSVNQIDQVEVTGAGNVLLATLQRRDNAWVVDEFGGYAADWPQLRDLLASLARAEVIEPKTSNPEYFSRLGVSDVESADSEATLLRLKGGGDEYAVLVGNAAEGQDGQYVRLFNGDRALLIDQSLKLPASPKDWLQRDIVNISDAEVVEVEVTHPDGSLVRAVKASADDDDFVLQDVPQGREVLSSWSVNSMANALANLQLDSVAKADTVDFSQATRFRLLTADGLEIEAEIAAVPAPASTDEAAAAMPAKTWLRLSAQSYQADGNAAEDSGSAASEPPPGDADATIADENAANESTAEPAGPESPEAEDAETAAERAEGINQRVSGWAFEIPSYKADAMTKQMDDLLKALPEEE